MAKKDGTVDLRIKRTQRSIKEALFTLLQENDFEHLSVKDITDEAMISRNTFYLHYTDKYDLLNKVCDDLMRSLFFRVGKQLRRVQREEFTVENVATVIQKGIMTVVENREAYQVLLSGSAGDILTTKLQDMIRSIFNIVRQDLKNIPECSAEYIIAGMAGVVKYYVNNDVGNLIEESISFTYLHMSGIISIINDLALSKNNEK